MIAPAPAESVVYLDYNANTPVRPEARDAALAVMAAAGNPSSVHASGRSARATVERARAQVAALVGSHPNTVLFTSGGTEANCLAIRSAVASGTRRLIISAVEHDSVRETALASGLPVAEWAVDGAGVADLGWLEAMLSRWPAADGPPFVALMAASNETGVLQPIAAAATLVRAAGGWLHVDAVQAAGKVALDQPGDGIDTIACSAHKIGGLIGAGALAVAPGRAIAPLITGGGQERNLRSGTENVTGIAAFGAAAQAAVRDRAGLTQLSGWRERCAARLGEAADVVLLGQDSARVPGTLCFAARGFDSTEQVMAMDFRGIMVSAGSACSAGKMRANRVVAAMGHDTLAGSVLRVSGGWDSTEADWDAFAAAWIDAFAANARLAAARR